MIEIIADEAEGFAVREEQYSNTLLVRTILGKTQAKQMNARRFRPSAKECLTRARRNQLTCLADRPKTNGRGSGDDDARSDKEK